MDLEGRTALVTGGSRGIGLAIAQKIAEAGARVVISSRREENLAQALETFRDQTMVHAVTAHVGSRLEADRLVRASIEHFGSLDSGAGRGGRQGVRATGHRGEQRGDQSPLRPAG